jgi:quercetin dioxygenase-like cupin family protein
MDKRRRMGLGVFAAAGLSAILPFATVSATPSSGLTTMNIARSIIAEEFKVHAHTDFLNVKIESKGPVDAVVNNNKLAPGGTVGWHSHTGPVIVQIRKGAMTLYDEACNAQVVFAGQAFVENVTGDHAHTVRNEGGEDLEWTGTSLIPVGAAGRIDRPAPGGCPF